MKFPDSYPPQHDDPEGQTNAKSYILFGTLGLTGLALAFGANTMSERVMGAAMTLVGALGSVAAWATKEQPSPINDPGQPQMQPTAMPGPQ